MNSTNIYILLFRKIGCRVVLAMLLAIVSASTFAISDEFTQYEMTDADHAFYDALKKRIPTLMEQEGWYPAGFDNLVEGCAGFEMEFGEESNELRRRLSEMAFIFANAEVGFSGYPERVWRPLLEEQEEIGLWSVGDMLSVRDEYVFDKFDIPWIVNAINKDGARTPGWKWLDPPYAECGAGEVLVKFEHKPGDRVQYQLATFYDICQSLKDDAPVGLCEWTDYSGEGVLVAGRIKVRVKGRDDAMYTFDIDSRTTKITIP